MRSAGTADLQPGGKRESRTKQREHAKLPGICRQQGRRHHGSPSGPPVGWRSPGYHTAQGGIRVRGFRSAAIPPPGAGWYLRGPRPSRGYGAPAPSGRPVATGRGSRCPGSGWCAWSARESTRPATGGVSGTRDEHRRRSDAGRLVPARGPGVPCATAIDGSRYGRAWLHPDLRRCVRRTPLRMVLVARRVRRLAEPLATDQPRPGTADRVAGRVAGHAGAAPLRGNHLVFRPVGGRDAAPASGVAARSAIASLTGRASGIQRWAMGAPRGGRCRRVHRGCPRRPSRLEWRSRTRAGA